MDIFFCKNLTPDFGILATIIDFIVVAVYIGGGWGKGFRLESFKPSELSIGQVSDVVLPR